MIVAASDDDLYCFAALLANNKFKRDCFVAYTSCIINVHLINFFVGFSSIFVLTELSLAQ